MLMSAFSFFRGAASPGPMIATVGNSALRSASSGSPTICRSGLKVTTETVGRPVIEVGRDDSTLSMEPRCLQRMRVEEVIPRFAEGVRPNKVCHWSCRRSTHVEWRAPSQWRGSGVVTCSLTCSWSGPSTPIEPLWSCSFAGVPQRLVSFRNPLKRACSAVVATGEVGLPQDDEMAPASMHARHDPPWRRIGTGCLVGGNGTLNGKPEDESRCNHFGPLACPPNILEGILTRRAHPALLFASVLPLRTGEPSARDWKGLWLDLLVVNLRQAHGAPQYGAESA
ncbi:hypothetical protein B0T16DRAFT_102221 [Cercophora newfieldiana]|uniref:Uncharacterized protein n=1 Tax=Cercophora newfieldiana TaxID=92897 RepID=A0AA39YH25_9PEZI|nr:hypothetical protein B0T16DRAFT_102221 [Cercophora newfieldiana]